MMTKSLIPQVVCVFLFTAILAMLVFPLGAFAAGVLENRNLVPLVVDPIPNYNSVLSAVPLDRFDRIEALTSTFTINYLPAGAGSYGDTCTTWPVAAQTAFESAVNIWASRLVSAVPITIDACWATNLSAGMLGHSGSLGFFRNFTNAPVADTWYAATLANALAGSKLNTGSSDIYIAYSNIFNWYYGTDGLTPPTQMDFVSVVAHEIAHGLGFAGSMTVASGSGSWGSGTAYPFAYDRLAFVGSSQGLTNTSIYPNPSVALGTALTSNNVWFTGSNAKSANGGTNAKLYAPATWTPGSSYSHLDYSTFTGTANALMVYAISYGRAIHDPGTVTMGLLQDLGWTTASMLSNGACGSSNNGVFTITPATNLCSSGTASAVSVSDPWTWACNGSNGGTTTNCMAYSSSQQVTLTPFPQNFDSVGVLALPAGWASAGSLDPLTGYTSMWQTNIGTRMPGLAGSGTTGASAHSGSTLVYFNSYDVNAGMTALLSSPAFSLVGKSGAKASFWMYRDPYYYPGPPQNIADLVNVYVNTAPSLSGASLLGTVNRYISLSPVVSAAGWYQYTFDIPATFTGNSNHLLFNGVSDYGLDIHLDDITVYAFTPVYPLTFTFAGTGYGSLNSAPPGVSCTGTTGSMCAPTNFTGGAVVVLSASADSSSSYNSTFAGWTTNTTACSGTGTCSVTLSVPTTVSGTFNRDKLVKISPTGVTYGTLLEANTVASSGQTIQVRDNSALTPFDDALIINKNITLIGGFASGFATNNGYTTTKGKLTIIGNGGVLKVQRIIIR